MDRLRKFWSLTRREKLFLFEALHFVAAFEAECKHSCVQAHRQLFASPLE